MSSSSNSIRIIIRKIIIRSNSIRIIIIRKIISSSNSNRIIIISSSSSTIIIFIIISVFSDISSRYADDVMLRNLERNIKFRINTLGNEIDLFVLFRAS